MVGDWMCFQISLTMWGWLKIRDFCERNRWKFFEQIFVVAYLHVVSFTKHEKDTATKVSKYTLVAVSFSCFVNETLKYLSISFFANNS